VHFVFKGTNWWQERTRVYNSVRIVLQYEMLLRESNCHSWVNHHYYTTLHHCYCRTHPASLLLRDSNCITVEAWLILITVTAWLIYSNALPMWLILHQLLRNSYCITVDAWHILHYCYCVTHIASLLMRDSSCITVTAWLIYSISLPMWLTLHQQLRDSYYIIFTAWFI
jgi:hypothetical protein